MSTKEQFEIVDFTRKEIERETIACQDKMYWTICMIACMTWPNEIESFQSAFVKGYMDRNNLTEHKLTWEELTKKIKETV